MPVSEIGVILAYVLLLVAHALLVACEFSLIKIRYIVLERKDLDELRSDHNIRRLLDKAKHTSQFIRFGNVVTTILIVALFFLFVREYTDLSTPSLKLLQITVSFLVILVILYFFGEVLPRTLAISNPKRILKAVSLPVFIIQLVLWPVLYSLQYLTAKILRLFKLNTKHDINLLDIYIQIRALGEDKAVLTKQTRKIITNALKIKDLVASDILLPRNQIEYLNINDPIATNLAKAKSHGHTRLPLCDGDLDNCIGFVHIKNIFIYSGNPDELDLRKIKHPIIRFSITTSVEDILQKFLKSNIHMALVVDEFGGTIGIVTLERLLEELVGDIQDEFDNEEKEVVHIAEQRYKVFGSIPIHDLDEALNITIKNDAVSTFSGLITSELGRIPLAGETLTIGNLAITVDEVGETRVISATVEILPTPEGHTEA
ncbi:MAG: hypothetical protein A2007_02365 [Verrucomicrobia bacterium GWC2_42_7]|nr:MAG: hypothetical protein A2007_02365 [Verrucomicrobia bacterium GWC2_42_7]